MDRQHEHIFVGDSDHHGFLLDHTDKCIDPIFEERIAPPLGIAEFGLRIDESKPVLFYFPDGARRCIL